MTLNQLNIPMNKSWRAQVNESKLIKMDQSSEKYHPIIDAELINLLRSVGIESLLDFDDMHNAVNWLDQVYLYEKDIIHDMLLIYYPFVTSIENAAEYFRNITNTLVLRTARLMIEDDNRYPESMFWHYAYIINLLGVKESVELSKKLYELTPPLVVIPLDSIIFID